MLQDADYSLRRRQRRLIEASTAEPKLRPEFTLRWELLTALELIDISLKGGLFARGGDAGDGRGRYLSHWCRTWEAEN